MLTFDITIPVLNEEATLAQQIQQLHQFISNNYPQEGQWKIVIADNGSTDRTPEIAEQLAIKFSEIHYLKVSKRGVGLALKTSWSQSSADIVGYMDLDLATDLPHFLEAYTAITEDKYDLVYATRLHPQSKVIGRPFKREVASRGFNFLLKTYLGVNYSDGMCGFKWLQRKHVAPLIAAGADNDGWFFSTELLTLAEWKGLEIRELPVQWTDDVSSSKVKILPLAKRYIRGMRALKRKK